MTETGQLSPEQSELLVSLPYRVGIWMSHADDEAGELDDSREIRALEKTIGSIAKVHEKSPMVQSLMQETLNQKGLWDRWAAQSFDILNDCEKAVHFLNTTVGKNDMNHYRRALMQIARTVAEAHGEFGMEEDPDESALGRFLDKVVTKLKGDEDEGGFMNISPAEEAALQRLKQALSTVGN